MLLSERVKEVVNSMKQNNRNGIPIDFEEQILKLIKKQNLSEMQAADIIIDMINRGDEEDHDVLQSVICILLQHNPDMIVHFANLVIYEKARREIQQ